MLSFSKVLYTYLLKENEKQINKQTQAHKYILAMYFQCSVVSNTNGLALEVRRCNAEYHLLIQILIDVSELSVWKRQTDAAIRS